MPGARIGTDDAARVGVPCDDGAAVVRPQGDHFDALLVCAVSVSRPGHVSFNWISAGLNVPPKRAVVSLCWVAGCHLSEWCIKPACYQLRPEARLASATVLIGASACSAGVQQALRPQQESLVALSSAL